MHVFVIQSCDEISLLEIWTGLMITKSYLGLVVPRVTLALNQLLNKVQIGPELMTTLGLGCLQCLQAVLN